MTQTKAWFNINWFIELNFCLYRDYRIIKMADAQGVIREGIFIPFIQNGIKYNSMSRQPPRQRLKPQASIKGNKFANLIPYVNSELRKKMVTDGVLSPRDKFGFSYVGFVYNDLEFINHKGDE